MFLSVYSPSIESVFQVWSPQERVDFLLLQCPLARSFIGLITLSWRSITFFSVICWMASTGIVLKLHKGIGKNMKKNVLVAEKAPHQKLLSQTMLLTVGYDLFHSTPWPGQLKVHQMQSIEKILKTQTGGQRKETLPQCLPGMVLQSTEGALKDHTWVLETG